MSADFTGNGRPLVPLQEQRRGTGDVRVGHRRAGKTENVEPVVAGGVDESTSSPARKRRA